jgi:tetratricopeptide (TPR) repeat protein
MSARGVSVRISCLLFAACLGVQAQLRPDVVTQISPQAVAVSPYEHAQAMLNANEAATLPTIPIAPLGGTISVKRLAHVVPGKAVKEYEKAKKARQSGDIDRAMTSLQRALEIDPEFIEAVNDMGACHTAKQNFSKAANYFDRAIRIDSHYWPAFYNLALMSLLQNKMEDAERAARTASDLDRTGSTSRLLLGIALVFQDKFTDEAVTSLEKARGEFPQAHLVLARALAARGKRTEARSELETFLAGKPSFGADLAQSWLKVLR